IFFLHDGRTTDLLVAIRAHRSAASSQFGASEANQVINVFDALLPAQQQDILNFLRSLSRANNIFAICVQKKTRLLGCYALSGFSPTYTAPRDSRVCQLTFPVTVHLDAQA